VALAVPFRARRVLVGQRGTATHLAGLWEFPGGKIGPGEAPADAARRELREETGLAGGEAEALLVHAHDYPDRSVRLHVFLIREPMGDPARGWIWVGLDDLDGLDLPPANAPIVPALRRRLGA
jgi:8-oxo-dGTP diphosphatase